MTLVTRFLTTFSIVKFHYRELLLQLLTNNFDVDVHFNQQYIRVKKKQ